MTMHISKANVTYVSVPKCACSTLKHFGHEVENGVAYDPEASGNDVHSLYRSINMTVLQDGNTNVENMFAVVRHPVDRIVSAYSDKIARRDLLTKNEKVRGKLVELGLSTQPDFDLFVERLADYRASSPMINHHTRPLSFFLGTSPEKFEKIFGMHQIAEFCAEVNARAGTSVDVKHVNKKKNVAKKFEVTDNARNVISQAYAEDLSVFGDYFGTVA
ncbi:MAG: sulfotransferase family 2 domain-containing protein [Tateyamaria sp.]|uniref:sulfotransferase family 2 domain-containing protein n=1 Tax=Tateyamaria sp. TaxID=1929288 RepID=UPI003271E683